MEGILHRTAAKGERSGVKLVVRDLNPAMLLLLRRREGIFSSVYKVSAPEQRRRDENPPTALAMNC